MICQLYRGHWELILAKLADSDDTKFAEAVSGRVNAAIEEQPDAVCVAVEGQAAGFRKLAGMIQGTLEEIADVILMQCAADVWFQRWDEVDDVAFVAK